jgi:hypothetical protein
VSVRLGGPSAGTTVLRARFITINHVF